VSIAEASPRSRLAPRRNAVLLGGYARRHFLAWTAGWSFAITIYLTRLVQPLIGFALWTKAIPDDPRLAAYFVAMVFCVMATDSPENHTFAQRVYDGAFTDDLLRPHPIVFHTIGFNVAFKAFNVLGAIPIVVVVGSLTDVHVDGGRVLLTLPAMVIGSAIAFCLFFTLAQSAFWTPRVHAVSAAGTSLVFLLGGGAAPIPFLPEALRPWLSVLPFRMINGFPCEVLSGMTTGNAVMHGYVLQLVWLAVLIVACRLVWVAGVRRYVAIGG
jgi:ABC-2 type transport system permease protein